LISFADTIEQGFAQVLFKLPNQKAEVWLDDDPGLLKIEGEQFVIQPFENSLPCLSIRKQKQWNPRSASSESSESSVIAQDAEANYLSTITTVVKAIKAGDLQKCVISRVKEVPKPTDFSAENLFNGLAATYPDAFCYVLYHPRAGLWAGASPEVLLQSHRSSCTTMALAATRRYSSTIQWNDKEEDEHEMVVGYIMKALRDSSCTNITKERRQTSRAGALAHLRTPFTFESPDPWLTALKLHPTPATCGLPKLPALELINELEPHDRELYCGFVGPRWNKNSMDLFVNLRCMKITDRCQLYVGGGITAASDPLSEWEETEMKSQTMLRVL
jgi:isochorismate synthase